MRIIFFLFRILFKILNGIAFLLMLFSFVKPATRLMRWSWRKLRRYDKIPSSRRTPEATSPASELESDPETSFPPFQP